MSKRVIALVMLSLVIMSFAVRNHEPKTVDAFKVEQIGVRM